MKLIIESGNNVTIEMQNLEEDGSITLANPNPISENDQDNKDLTLKNDDNRVLMGPPSPVDKNQDSRGIGGKSEHQQISLRSGKVYTNWADLEVKENTNVINCNSTQIDETLSNVMPWRNNDTEYIRKYKELNQRKKIKLQKEKELREYKKRKNKEYKKIKDLKKLEELQRIADLGKNVKKESPNPQPKDPYK